jgi:hypothetical protein
MAHPARRKESGQIYLTVALLIATLLACAGLATDLGFFQNQRRRMQSAADSAAIAGERELMAGNTSTIVSAAQNDASINGFKDGSNQAIVTVNNPPLGGGHSGDSNAVEVIVKQPQPTFLLGVLGMKSVNVSTRAVAIEGGSLDCIYALNPTAEETVAFGFGVSLFLSNCGIIDDSNNQSEAMSFEIVSLVKAASFSVVGKVGSFLITLVSPKPVTGAPPVPDPFARLQAPAVGSCDHINYQVPLLGNATINPGVYCGGITSPLASVGTLTLNPGTYILNGGGLQFTGVAILKNATTGGDGHRGVTFYITGNSTYHYEGVNLTGAAINSLNAPTSGPYEGILFFQDRSISTGTASAHPNTIIGVTLARYEGVLYFPTTKLIYAGANLAAYTIIVADQIQFPLANVTYIYSDYSSLSHGNPVKGPVLAE